MNDSSVSVTLSMTFLNMVIHNEENWLFWD